MTLRVQCGIWKAPFKVTLTTFYEISKMSDICSIFRKNVYIEVVHIFETSFVFSLLPRKRGSKLRNFMTDIHNIPFKFFCIFFAS